MQKCGEHQQIRKGVPDEIQKLKDRQNLLAKELFSMVRAMDALYEIGYIQGSGKKSEIHRSGSFLFCKCPNPSHREHSYDNCCFKEDDTAVYCQAEARSYTAYQILKMNTGMQYHEIVDRMFEMAGRPSFFREFYDIQEQIDAFYRKGKKQMKTEQKKEPEQVVLSAREGRLAGLSAPSGFFHLDYGTWLSEAGFGTDCQNRTEEFSWNDFMSYSAYKGLVKAKIKERSDELQDMMDLCDAVSRDNLTSWPMNRVSGTYLVIREAAKALHVHAKDIAVEMKTRYRKKFLSVNELWRF